MRMDENLTRFNSLFAGDGPNRLFVYFQVTDTSEEVSRHKITAKNFLLAANFNVSQYRY